MHRYKTLQNVKLEFPFTRLYYFIKIFFFRTFSKYFIYFHCVKQPLSITLSVRQYVLKDHFFFKCKHLDNQNFNIDTHFGSSILGKKIQLEANS